MHKGGTLSVKYSIVGLLTGVSIALILLAIRFLFIANPTASTVQVLLYGIVFLIPVFLAVMAGYVGKVGDRRVLELQLRVEEERNKTRLVATASENLVMGEGTGVLRDLQIEEELKASLIRLNERIETAKESDLKRSWVNEGIAGLHNVLRSDNDKLEVLCDHIISYLVRYLNANQAGLFLTSEAVAGKQTLQLISCYAYERKKFLTKTVKAGEGLVGQVYLEKRRIFLKEIPEDYINITSGLGHAPPRYLVVLPLKSEEQVLGVLEISTFACFEENHLELLDKASEIIATNISTKRINENTMKLLTESQQQAEEMKAQEEEMRQNMEELAATQEDSKRKEEELKKVLVELKKNEVRQRIAEMSITIQSALENARRELLFLRCTPPVKGILSARSNGGVDPKDGSSEKDWVDRFNVIIENLMITKNAYEKILFIGKNGLITGIFFDGQSTHIALNDVLEDHEAPVLTDWDKDTIYVDNPKTTKTGGLHIRMYLPVYHESDYRGFICLSLQGTPLVGEIKKREDNENKFLLCDGLSNVLYSGGSGPDSDMTYSEKIPLNDKEGFHLSISHIS